MLHAHTLAGPDGHLYHTHLSALRVRVWRVLKATSAGTLREGIYMLPEHAQTASTLWELERTIADASADAHLLVVPARDESREQAFRALFDRSEPLQSVAQLQAHQACEFFPGQDSRRSAKALAVLRRGIECHLAPDEPPATTAASRCDALPGSLRHRPSVHTDLN